MRKYLLAGVAAAAAFASLWLFVPPPAPTHAQTINHVQSAVLDELCAPAQGMILYRAATGWTCLAAGTNGRVLTTGGASANPSWTAATNATTGTSGATVPLLDGNNTYSGTSAFTGAVSITGVSVALPIRTVTASGTITVSATTDYMICVNKSVAAATAVSLPATPATGLTFVIKDCKGDATANPITVTPAAGNIDNAGTLVLGTDLNYRTLTYNGTQWVTH